MQQWGGPFKTKYEHFESVIIVRAKGAASLLPGPVILKVVCLEITVNIEC